MATASDHRQEDTNAQGFLSLPPETRTMIYQYTWAQTIRLGVVWPETTQQNGVVSRALRDLALTCRASYLKAMPMVYERTVFHIKFPSEADELEAERTLDTKEFMQKIYSTCPMSSVRRLPMTMQDWSFSASAIEDLFDLIRSGCNKGCPNLDRRPRLRSRKSRLRDSDESVGPLSLHYAGDSLQCTQGYAFLRILQIHK